MGISTHSKNLTQPSLRGRASSTVPGGKACKEDGLVVSFVLSWKLKKDRLKDLSKLTSTIWVRLVYRGVSLRQLARYT